MFHVHNLTNVIKTKLLDYGYVLGEIKNQYERNRTPLGLGTGINKIQVKKQQEYAHFYALIKNKRGCTISSGS